MSTLLRKERYSVSDHIHVLIKYLPKLSISVIVNALKGFSSHRYGQAGFTKPCGKASLSGLTHKTKETGFLALILRMKSGFLVQKPGFCVSPIYGSPVILYLR